MTDDGYYNLTDPGEAMAWEAESLKLSNQARQWICLDREAKKKRLERLYRMGSQMYEHGRRDLAMDEHRLLDVLHNHILPALGIWDAHHDPKVRAKHRKKR